MDDRTKKELKIAAGVGAVVFALAKALMSGDGKKDRPGAIKKGDKIVHEGKRYNVEDVKWNWKGGQNLYAVCRMDPVEDGTKMKLTCLKIVAREDELKRAE